MLSRLNFRLSDKCEEDINTLCGEACALYTGQACGGRVLRCLTEKQDQVQSKVCLRPSIPLTLLPLKASESRFTTLKA